MVGGNSFFVQSMQMLILPCVCFFWGIMYSLKVPLSACQFEAHGPVNLNCIDPDDRPTAEFVVCKTLKCLGLPNIELLNSVSTESDTAVGKCSQTWLPIPTCYRDKPEKADCIAAAHVGFESIKQKPWSQFNSCGICFWIHLLGKVVLAYLPNCDLSCLNDRVRFYQLACQNSKVAFCTKLGRSWCAHP